MEVILKILVDFVKFTKAFWFVLLGAGIAIYAHYRLNKLTLDREIEERKSRQYHESNKDKIEALKNLYKLTDEVTHLYNIYMSKVKYKISRKDRDQLPDEIDELSIHIIENMSKASMLVQFYAIEKNITFDHFQKTITRGLNIWDNYRFIDIKNKKGKKDKKLLEKLTSANIELINRSLNKVKVYEAALKFRIGYQGRKIIRSGDPYVEGLDKIKIA